MSTLPFKLNQDRRHRIPRQRHRVTNWREYDASLRRRGSLTVWFTDEAIQAWAVEPRTTRGGQPWYSALAILTALTLRAVFRLAYRQAEVSRGDQDSCRIASPEMLPTGDLLPHVICSPPVFAGGGEHEADQHDDA